MAFRDSRSSHYKTGLNHTAGAAQTLGPSRKYSPGLGMCFLFLRIFFITLFFIILILMTHRTCKTCVPLLFLFSIRLLGS